MPRRKKSTPAAPPPRRWRVVAAVGATLAVAGGAVWALGLTGDEALRQIGARGRYRVAFADIACAAPPGTDRATFLTEVRYVGLLPDALNPLDAADRDRVRAGFSRHPWVAGVDDVAPVPGGGLRVDLAFRTPVLAVTTSAGTPRLLDRGGVLLPVAPTPPGVAELAGTVAAPTVAAGEVWPDPVVTAALRLVETYQPARLERRPPGWRLTGRDGRLYDVQN